MNEETENVVEEPEIIEEPEVIEEPEPVDPDFTGYKVVIYDRGAETPSWQVLLDTSSGENLGITKASVENKLNEAGSFSYSIVPTHPLYDMTSPMRVYVSVMEGPVEIFYGRILSVQTNLLTKIKAVTCEGALAFLLDAELPIDTEDREMTAANYFKYCLNQYNSAIKINNNTYDELRRLRVGVIDVDDASETYPYKNSSYTQIQSVMKNQLLNTHDGFFKIRRTIGSSTDTYYHYLDWKKLSGAYKSTVLYEGTNIIDQTNTASGEDLFTIIRPVGNNDLTLSGDDELMNVSSSMVAKYGKIIRSVNFDADNESDLKSKAIKYRNKIKNRLSITGDISFVDFCFLLGSDTGLSLHVGDIIPTLQEYGIDNAIVESLTRDLLDPGKDKLSLKSDKDLMRSERASGANGSNNSGVKVSTKIGSGGGSRGGGGGGPSQYIKSATLSTDGKTLTLTPNHGTPIDFSKATTLEGAWSSGTLTVSAYQTNKGIKSNVGTFVSDHLLALSRAGSEISEAFRADLRTADTGEDVIYPNLRISKDIYLHENVNGTNSNVVAGGNVDGSNPVASISVRSTYYAGKASVELIDPTWDPATTTSGTYVESNTAKVRTSGRAHGTVQEQEKEVKVYLTKGTTWTNNKLTVFLHSGTIDGPVQAATEVDASSVFYAGKASVGLSNVVWEFDPSYILNYNRLTIKTSGRTDSTGARDEITARETLYLVQGEWDSYDTIDVTLRRGTSSGDAYARTTVNASPLVTNATYAGKSSVGLEDLTWTPTSSPLPKSQEITARTLRRTNASGTVDNITKTLSLSLAQGTTWTDNKLPVTLKAGSGLTPIAETTVDASTLVSNARTAGRAAVDITDLTWESIEGGVYKATQKITAKTINRSPEEMEKTLDLTLSPSGRTVSLQAGSGNTVIAKATCTDSHLTAANIKYGVKIFDVTGTLHAYTLQDNRTPAKYTTNGEKTITPSDDYDGMKKVTITIDVNPNISLPTSVSTSSTATTGVDKEYSASRSANYIYFTVTAGSKSKKIQIHLLNA